MPAVGTIHRGKIARDRSEFDVTKPADSPNTPAPTHKHNSDVRMRGFASRSTVQAAWDWVDGQTGPLSEEVVPLDSASGRVLARDVISPVNVPAFDRSAMDGYAVRGEETSGAGDYSPVVLRVVGESRPAVPSAVTVEPGTAVRIMTGAPIPAGADAVVPAEYANETAGQVQLTTTVAAGKHVGRIGEDIAAGAALLPAGRRLRPQDLGVLASVGLDQIFVVRKPKVRVIVTGTEVVAPGAERQPNQIFDANSNMLLALVERDGGCVVEHRLLGDRREEIRLALTEPGADVILVSGGSSVGAEDFAPLVVSEAGELSIHGIAMRPSSPTGIGRIGDAFVFLLPGNPVSCLCAYDFFAGRALRRLGRRTSVWPYPQRSVRVARKITSAVGRTDYCRVRVETEGIVPLAISGASILSSTTRADGFVIVPEDLEGYPPGAEVVVYSYDFPLAS